MQEQIEQVRKFHGELKRNIILDAYSNIPYRIPTEPTSVLDLCCFRGGDIHKYFHVNYEQVIGIDKSSQSIQTALNRYNSIYTKKKRAKDFNVRYMVHDLKTKELRLEKQVDTIVMNFALNYFFDKEESIIKLMQVVSKNLKNGGMFVGIALDGQRVQERSRYPNTLHRVFVLERMHDEELHHVFGNMYKYELLGSNEEDEHYFQTIKAQEEQDLVVEYLIDVPEFVNIAKRFNLEPIEISYVTNDILTPVDEVFYLDFVFKFMKRIDDIVQPPSLPKSDELVITDDNNAIISISEDIKKQYFPQVFGIEYTKLMFTTESLYSSSRLGGGRLLCKIIEDKNKNPNIIVDATSNIGTDTIALALKFKDSKIIACEIDPINANALQNNINVFNLNNIVVRVGNSIEILDSMLIDASTSIDVLYIDAPWGGKDYKQNDTMSLFLDELELSDIFNKYHDKVGLFVFKIPKQYDIDYFENHLKHKHMIYEYKNYKVKNVIKFKFMLIN